MTAVITTGQAIIATMVAALPLRGELNPTVLLNNYEPGMPEARSISDMLNAAVPLDLEKGEIGRPIQRRDTVAAALWSRLTAYPPTRQTLELLNAAMILLADHDMAASTLAARVAASTRAHPYAVVSAGLAALDGPLHGAASGLSYELIADALRTGDPVRIVSDRLRTGGVLPGFGHALYPSGDPRATALLALLRVVGPSATMDLVDNLIKASGRRPNIDFAVAALALAYEMPVDAGEAIFAIARTAGWIAHSLEEYSDRPSRFRPSGLYAGQRPIV
jgi:citrate synthase